MESTRAKQSEPFRQPGGQSKPDMVDAQSRWNLLANPKAFGKIHVNRRQHAHSCPKSHASWLHFAAGQIFWIVELAVST